MQYKKIIPPFKLYLKTQGASVNTVRNYSSDIRHFFSWLQEGEKLDDFYFDDPNKISQKISKTTFKKYKQFLKNKAVSPSTINRRLSGLRQLTAFFASQGWLENEKAKNIPNITDQNKESKRSQLLNRFAKNLKNEGKSQSTVRNYLADVRGYLDYLQQEKQINLS